MLWVTISMWEIVGGVVRHRDIVVKIKITNFFLVCLLVIGKNFLLYSMWYMSRRAFTQFPVTK